MIRISQKFLVFMIFLALSFLLILWTFQIAFLEKNYIDSKRNETHIRAETLGKMIDENQYEASDYIAKTDELYNTGIIILNKRGVPEYISRPVNNVVLANCVALFFSHNTSYSDFVEFKNLGQTFARSFYQLNNGGGVFLLAHVAEVSDTVEFLKKQFYALSVVVILVAAAISAFGASHLSRPLMQLDSHAAQLAKGDLNTPIKSASKDEIGHLAKTLEFLRLSLKREDKLRKELIGNVSHELKTPLSIIKGFAETVRDISYKDQAKRERHLNIIIEETDRLTKIVEDIMDYSQLQAGAVRYSFKDVDLKAVADEICRLTGEHFSKNGVKLESKLCDVVVWGDDTKLSQVVMNLVANAFNHSSEGMTIRVTLEVNDNLATLRVIDEGSGIEEADIDNIWERHYKAAHRNREERIGSGLGLAICKSILEAHKAEYGVKSEVGKGSEFYFTMHVKQ